MPSVMVYIRQTDYEKWLSIENKSQWLHEHLNDPYIYYKGKRIEPDNDSSSKTLYVNEPKLIPTEDAA